MIQFWFSDRMNDIPEQTNPMDRTGDNGRKPLKARVRVSLIIDQLDREIDAELTRQFGIPAHSEKELLSPLAVCSSRWVVLMSENLTR